MRKIMIITGILSLGWLTVILAVWIGSHLLTTIVRVTQPDPQSSLLLVGQHTVRPDQIAVFEALVGDSYEICVTDRRTGQTWPLTQHFSSDRLPALSPDGKFIAFVSWRDGNSDIYLIDLATGTLHNVSRDPAGDILPVWSPDGTLLAFTSWRDGNAEIYLADVQRHLLQNLTHNPSHDGRIEWWPDNQGLGFQSNRSGTQEPYQMRIGGREVIRTGPDRQWQSTANRAKLEVHPETSLG